MQKFKPQFQRIIFIHKKLLNAGSGERLPNCRTLAQEWEVSRKTILRDIDYMKYQLEAPIEYDRKLHGYYYTDDTYKLPMMFLKEGDLFAIYLAEKVLYQYKDTPLYENLAQVFRKISSGLPEKVTVAPELLDSRFSFIPEPAPALNTHVWELVFKALFTNKILDIEYLTAGEKRTKQREIEPYHILGFRNEWYIVGYCHFRKDIRMFALSRIKNAAITNKKFQVPETFDINHFIGDHFGVVTGSTQYLIKVRFTEKCATYARERQWHPQQKLYMDGNDTILEFTTTHLIEAVRWALSWGSCAKVEGGPGFLEAVKRELQTTIAHY